MSDKKAVTPVALAVGAAIAGLALGGTASADTGASPFAMTTLSAGYMLGVGGEGACGGDKGGDKQKGEGACGGDKEKGEGACGGDKEKSEGACGEGSCGGDKDEAEDEAEE